MDSTNTEKENQVLADDSQENFLTWWQSRVKLRRFIPRTFTHEESASELARDAFQAGWLAAKIDEGYHQYRPPMNTLKTGCIVCSRSPDNPEAKHFEVHLESTFEGNEGKKGKQGKTEADT